MSERFYIAIDGGGTGTRVGLYDEEGNLRSEITGARSNPYQTSPHAAAEYVAGLAKSLLRNNPDKPIVVSAGISGARDVPTREVFAHTLCGNVPNVERVVVTTDVHAHLIANAGRHAAALVIAGTGSSVAVRDANGFTSLFGGRGPILGDEGSAFDLAVRALRTSVATQDREVSPPDLLRELLRAANLIHEDDLVAWCASAKKEEIARLAEVVLILANRGETLSLSCAEEGAKALGVVVESAVQRAELGLKAPIFLAGGLFESSFLYREMFARALKERAIENELKLAPFIGHSAALEFVRHLPSPESAPYVEVNPGTFARSESINLSVTQDDDSAPLDSLNTVMLIERMQRADAFAAAAVKACREPLALLINRVVRSFRHGGRLVYIGAGTSGRLGVLDASECPPTFGVPADQVIGIMAGGDRALRDSIEGAEDDADLGRADIEEIDPPIGNEDVVVGIAASGTTPYTLGALDFAKSRGAHTALICCNPNATVEVDYLLILPTGVEVLPGSTRLKAGTATKMVLNTITTGAMALSGRVFEGYMIGVQPTNAKLRKRAAHIISVLTGINEEDAARRLEESGNDVAVAVMMERLKIDADKARELLNKTRGDVRAAMAQFQSGEKKGGD
ncbi:MAG: N-acetylmuramic acid 6-phosphate etherase [Candidatus Hydrogenedentes bacterium]|nr:N-acetylmuramic acid 6-phosphate etherase [Candidatus Hydrogenedentota bacterium]